MNDPCFLRELLGGWEGLLRHRGPDGWGWYQSPDRRVVLFHRRLAITGISNGRQPLPNETRKIWLTFNGEIFNHRALRQEMEAKGHRFCTGTDAEVIVHLYEEKGMEALQALNGEFAFALYDSGADRLFLVRDRFGIKPLYYAHQSGALHFSSEIKGIFADPSFPRRFDPVTLQHHLQSFYFGTDTIFEGVRQVPPGHFLSYDLTSGKVQMEEYWRLPVGSPACSGSRQGMVEEFRHLFHTSVKMRIPEEVSYGAFLSGGLDSAAIVKEMDGLASSPFSVFSIGFTDPRYDEMPQSALLAEALELTRYGIRIGKGELSEPFIRSLWHSEIPVLNTHGAAKQMLAKTAREHCKVVLTGEGADELLMGYGLFAHLCAIEGKGGSSGNAGVSVLRGQLSGPLKRYSEVTDFFGAYPYPMQRHFFLRRISRLLLAGRYRQASRSWDWKDVVGAYFPPEKCRGLSSPEATQLFLLQTDFPSYLLNYLGDRQEMAAGLEGRTPFLDHPLVEFICSLPLDLKLRDGMGKFILREAMHGQLPDSIRLRPKQVFFAPALDSIGFFEHTGFWRRFISPEKIAETGVFHPPFFSFLVALARLLPRRSPLLPVVESIVVFVLSLQIVHELFVGRFEEWKDHFVSPHAADEAANHDAGRWYA